MGKGAGRKRRKSVTYYLHVPNIEKEYFSIAFESSELKHTTRPKLRQNCEQKTQLKSRKFYNLNLNLKSI